MVSLLPSATEIVCALGLREALVGRSHACDHPPGVAALPAVTEPKVPLRGTSHAVDQQVRALVGEGLSVHRVDGERLASLRPDVILTQDQCEVCAVPLADVEAALATSMDGTPRLVSLEPADLDDVWTDVERVADALGEAGRGRSLTAELRERAAGIAERAAASPERPTVGLIEWIDPPMAAGNWMPTLVQLAGGRNLFGEPGAHSPWLDWEAFVEADPEVIVVLPCGFPIPRTRLDLPALVRREGWSGLRAVREDRIALADGHRYFNRPGPRIVESLEILAEVLHPGVDYGHEGDGWAPW